MRPPRDDRALVLLARAGRRRGAEPSVGRRLHRRHAGDPAEQLAVAIEGPQLGAVGSRRDHRQQAVGRTHALPDRRVRLRPGLAVDQDAPVDVRDRRRGTAFVGAGLELDHGRTRRTGARRRTGRCRGRGGGGRRCRRRGGRRAGRRTGRGCGAQRRDRFGSGGQRGHLPDHHERGDHDGRDRHPGDQGDRLGVQSHGSPFRGTPLGRWTTVGADMFVAAERMSAASIHGASHRGRTGAPPA